MTLALDMPDCPDSPIRRLDPRWKLAGLLLAAVAIAIVQSWGPALAALIGAAVLVALARLPWTWYVRRITVAALLFVMFLIWLPLVPEADDATLDIGLTTISLTGLTRLGVLAAKLIAIVSVMLIIIATAPLPDTFKAAHALRVPGLLIHLVLLTYRYVFLLIEEFDRLRTAVRVRGFRNRSNMHSYRTIGQLAGTLLVCAHAASMADFARSASFARGGSMCWLSACLPAGRSVWWPGT
jgi:cobalt/nickel transport system permease protein